MTFYTNTGRKLTADTESEAIDQIVELEAEALKEATGCPMKIAFRQSYSFTSGQVLGTSMGKHFTGVSLVYEPSLIPEIAKTMSNAPKFTRSILITSKKMTGDEYEIENKAPFGSQYRYAGDFAEIAKLHANFIGYDKHMMAGKDTTGVFISFSNIGETSAKGLLMDSGQVNGSVSVDAKLLTK